MPIDVHFDMETQDPDDVFTLCLLATHPRVNLVGVTLFPGGFDQVGVVKHVLELVGRSDVPVGAVGHDDGKSRVSGFHYKWLGKVDPAEPDGSAVEILVRSSQADCVLLTGAPLRNVWAALNYQEENEGFATIRSAFFRHWVCQGGFAGDSVVPPEHRLEKFAGRETCPTFNLNGDVEASLGLLRSYRMSYIQMVSKNVCHGVIFDQERADKIPIGAHAGLDLLLDGMGAYFKKNPDGKALHDTIAAALMLNPRAATWVTGSPYRTRGEWGFIPDPPDFMIAETGHHDYPRMITTSVVVEAMYQSWSE